MAYRITHRLLNHRKLYGYRVVDTNDKEYDLMMLDLLDYAHRGLIEDVDIHKNRLRGSNRCDLRKLPRVEIAKAELPHIDRREMNQYENKCTFSTDTILIEMLRTLPYTKTRNCFDKVIQYLAKQTPKVCGLIGIRRTGKTVLMQQAIRYLMTEGTHASEILYVQVSGEIAAGEFNYALKGYINDNPHIKYVFIDEISFVKGFVNDSAYLSDYLVATLGKRVVLTGTDSLALSLASQEYLYDRIEMIHTTVVSYQEYTTIFGAIELEDYLKTGGIMGSDYFSTYNHVQDYLLTAVSENIRQSLLRTEDAPYWDGLSEILTTAQKFHTITNKIFYYTTTPLVLDTLRGELKFTKEAPHIAMPYDIGQVKELMDREVRIKTRVNLNKVGLNSIIGYLKDIHMIQEIHNLYQDTDKQYHITIPGIRYMITKEFIQAVLKSIGTGVLPLEVEKCIDNNVLGAILEGSILTESILKYGAEYVSYFRYSNQVEIDMVIYNKNTEKYDLYEVKLSHSKKGNQTKNFKAREVLDFFKDRIGEQAVIYMGEADKVGDIKYINAITYIKELHE